MIDLADVQGLIASGYGDRKAACYALFEITDPGKTRSWLGRIVDQIQFADFLKTKRNEPPLLKEEPLNLAFTYAGFARLGLMGATLQGFHPSFREGMATEHRSRQLGDDLASAPRNWRWGGPQQQEIHGVLCAFAGIGRCTNEADKTDQRLQTLLRAHISAESGLALVVLLQAHHSQARELQKEHFGFRDGISNPGVRGLTRGSDGGESLSPGEMLLGYPNAYGKLGRTPRVRACDDSARHLPLSDHSDLRDFGKNGSYLVFRQLQQDVAAFWQYAERAAASLGRGKDAVWLASRMVGRWPDGSPVTLCPDRDLSVDATDLNDFRFSEHDDAQGERCPIGSHIRRTFPRDTMLPVPHDRELSGDANDLTARKKRIALANTHRLLRRGRSYGPPLHAELDPRHMREDDGQERGLLFLCFNADLARQFEFVMSTWVVNPTFAGLSDDPDPLLAAGRCAPFNASDFTLQGCPARRVHDLPRFVETRGGAYFFMPSRSALLFLSELTAPCFERVEEREHSVGLDLASLHVRKVEADFKAQSPPRQAKRGFHAKCHGIVRATVKVVDDLGCNFEAGVFQKGASYPAWVRFSSASFKLQTDKARDVHGLAIKLLNVPDEPRAALFEQHTQDFVLIDAPALMVGTPRQALAFDRAQVRGMGPLIWHLLTHPREALSIARMVSAPRHLFEREYTSVTWFRHGAGRTVRYVMRLAPGQRIETAQAGASQLRDSLRATLARGDLSLELCIQMGGLLNVPVEDARRIYPVEAEPIARITLHADGFDSPEQERWGDNLSFNPWNALEAHRPLGALNRARRVVYRTVVETRSRLHGRQPFEPSDLGPHP